MFYHTASPSLLPLVFTFLTFLLFLSSTLSFITHIQITPVFDAIYFPVGLLTTAFGIFAIRRGQDKLVKVYAVSYVILLFGLLTRSILFFVSIPTLQGTLFPVCQSQGISQNECADIISTQVKAAVLLDAILIFLMILATVVIGRHAIYMGRPDVKNEEFELPMYDGVGRPPQVYSTMDPRHPYAWNSDHPPLYDANDRMRPTENPYSERTIQNSIENVHSPEAAALKIRKVSGYDEGELPDVDHPPVSGPNQIP